MLVLQLSRIPSVLSLVLFLSLPLLIATSILHFQTTFEVSLDIEAGRPLGRNADELFTSPRMAGVRDGRLI